jgi:hypothetical protein
MWYGSNLKWGREEEEMNHVIKYAYSTDGIRWFRSGRICIGLEHEGEYAVSKPVVVRIGDCYRMWYSFRRAGPVKGYRIGYAESADGLAWVRRDDIAGISVSEQGWDSEMVCYPFVFAYRDKLCMLYNGNGYGKTGFGLAIEDGRV